MQKWLLATALLFTLSCSSEKALDVRAPEYAEPVEDSRSGKETASQPDGQAAYALSIQPLKPTRSATLSTKSKGFHPDDVEFFWTVNGAFAEGASGTTFRVERTVRGDRIQATAVIRGEKISSNMVTVENALPVIKDIDIVPVRTESGNTFSVAVTATDADNDSISYDYAWTKNDEPAGTDRQMNVPVARGDMVAVTITAFDGIGKSRPMVVRKEILNFPPSIIESKKLDFDGTVFSYRVKAEDPEGDPLTYALKNPDEGMTITQEGLVQWQVPKEFVGKVSFEVSVSDDHGGTVSQKVAVTVTLPEGNKL